MIGIPTVILGSMGGIEIGAGGYDDVIGLPLLSAIQVE